jgi:hypothetical protein
LWRWAGLVYKPTENFWVSHISMDVDSLGSEKYTVLVRRKNYGIFSQRTMQETNKPLRAKNTRLRGRVNDTKI